MRKRELMICPKCGRLANARVKSTNHPFHFVMSILTVGFWLPIWLLCVIECMFHRPKIECDHGAAEARAIVAERALR